MQIHLIAVGTRMPEWVTQGFDEYAKRMPPECRLNLIEIPAGKRSKNADISKLTEQEGQRMQEAIPKGCKVIAMDVPGKLWSTEQLAEQIRDSNFRIFAEDEQLHLIGAGWHLRDTDPFELFEQLLREQPRNLDVTHAFYLGFELSKAITALTLGKQYRQDEALDWGFLTRPESSPQARRHGP